MNVNLYLFSLVSNKKGNSIFEKVELLSFMQYFVMKRT